MRQLLPILLLLLAGCVDAIDEPTLVPTSVEGLSKADFRETVWEITQTITFAPDEFGDLFGLSTTPTVVQWQITESHLAAVELQDTAADDFGMVGVVVAAYPITAHIGPDARIDPWAAGQDLGRGDSGSSGDETPWYRLDNFEVEWSNVVPLEGFDPNSLDGLVTIGSTLTDTSTPALAFFDAAVFGASDTFSDGELVAIEFDEEIRLEPCDHQCLNQHNDDLCSGFSILVHTEIRRMGWTNGE